MNLSRPASLAPSNTSAANERGTLISSLSWSIPILPGDEAGLTDVGQSVQPKMLLKYIGLPRARQVTMGILAGGDGGES